QPLPHIRVSGIAQNTLEQFTDLLKSQLNVKQVLYENKPDTFSKKHIQPDTKKLGPVLRKDLKKVLALIQKSEFEYGKDGQLCVDQYKISASDYTIGFQPIFEDEDLWYERQLVVSLCLSISDELKIEGTARNLNRYIQDLRKKLKLSYDDRIILSIEATGIYGQSISSHKKWLMEQSLAVDLKSTVEETMFGKNDAEGQLKIQVQKAKIDQK
ncbi:MAG: hypothetical protein HOJ48_17330, partial [Desulfobacula sp.]|nr:hypothetical protein [Desulfobacula sp.]